MKASTDPAPTDKPITVPTDKPATTDSTIFKPISAASAGSKKARAKKAAKKESISYMLLIQITSADKKIAEFSVEYLKELRSSFGYREELQKQSMVVAAKLREIKALQYTLCLGSRAEAVAEARGNTARRTIWKAVIDWRLRSW